MRRPVDRPRAFWIISPKLANEPREPPAPATSLPSAPHPDAKLLALGEKFKKAQAIAIAANARSLERDEHYEVRRLPVPASCRPKRGDYEALGLRSKRGTQYISSEVDQLRDLKAEREDFEVTETEDGTLKLRKVGDRERSQAAAIVERFD